MSRIRRYDPVIDAAIVAMMDSHQVGPLRAFRPCPHPGCRTPIMRFQTACATHVGLREATP